jgi:ApaG protein
MTHAIFISVDTKYLGHPMKPHEDKYAFSYTITIHNQGDETVQLLSRHWIIQDGDNDVQEVHGPGVVGQTPVIPSGKSFTYTSGTVVKTPVGIMHGTYHFVDSHSQPFDVAIPLFRLVVKAVLH